MRPKPARSRWRRAAAASWAGGNHSSPAASRTASSSPRATSRRTRSGCRPVARAKRVEVEPERHAAGERGGHRPLLGSKVEVVASSSKRRRSSSVSVGGHHDPDLGVEVAGAALRVGHAAALEAQALAARRAAADPHLGLAAGRVDGDRRAERGLPRGERQAHVDVAAVDPVAGVRRDAHDEVEVAGRRAVGALAALAGEPDALAVDDAGGDR